MQIIKDLIEFRTESNFREHCPVCGGNKTLSVTRDSGKYLYRCFKSSCNIRGVIGSSYTSSEIKERVRPTAKPQTKFHFPEHFIQGIANDACYRYIQSNHVLFYAVHNIAKVGYDPKLNRFLYFITRANEIVGAVGRALSHKTWPKVYQYDSPIIYPFIAGDTDTLVLVEDCASACAVTRIPELSGCALLGTFLQPDYVPVITKYKKVIICLDNDATQKSLTINKLLQYYTKTNIKMLNRDIKNMSQEELERFFTNG